MKYQRILLPLATLSLGCTTTSTVTQKSSIEQLKHTWTSQRAYQIDDELGQKYDESYNNARASRGREFEALARIITLLQPVISGRECLELLGDPDLWTLKGNSVGVVYFFDDAGRQHWVLDVDLSKDGNNVISVGWNIAGIKDFKNRGYHP